MPVARKSCNVKSVGNQSGSSSWCHAPSAPWRARTFRAEAFARDACALEDDRGWGSVRKIAHHLPADRRVRIEQPIDTVSTPQYYLRSRRPPRAAPPIAGNASDARSEWNQSLEFRYSGAMGAAFVGRDHELQTLLVESTLRSGRLALVSGEAGIGKTRLADEVSWRAEAEGWAVAWGRAWEGEGTPAFWPWLQVLRTFAASPALGGALDEAHAAWPELATLLSTRRGAAPADPEQARFRLFDAVASALRRMADERPLFVVLDDLHAADLSTLLLLRFVARDLRGARVFVVATARDVAFKTEERTSQVLAEVMREAVHVPLARLRRDDIAVWVGASAPRLASKVDAFFDASEGNPLFVEELLAAAAKRPESAWSSPQQMPLGIRDLIRRHLELPSAPAQALLKTASVLGRDFSLSACVAIEGCAIDDARRWTLECVAAGILVDVGDGRLRFAHVLLRDEMYARMGARRSDVHRAAARALAEEPALAIEHWLVGARAEDAGIAALVALDAVRDANLRLAFEDAALLGERALAVFGPSLPPRDQAALWMAIGDARSHGGEIAPGRVAYTRAAEIAEAGGDAETFTRAALAAAAEHSMRRNEATVTSLQRALRILPAVDSPLRAHAMARLFSAMLPAPPHEAAEFRALGEEALAMARRLGDEPTLFTVLCLLADGFPQTVEARERAAALTESIALGVRLGRSARVVPLLGRQIAGRYELGDPDGAERALAQAEGILARLAQPHYAWRAPLLRALVAVLQGRFAEATALHREVLQIATAGDVMPAKIFLVVHRHAFQYVRGDNDGYDEFAELGARTMVHLPLQEVFSALPDALAGRGDNVRVCLARLRELPLDVVPGATVLGWPCARVGASEHAEFFYDLACRQLAHTPIEFGPGGLTTCGPTALLAGHLALLLGRPLDAARHYEAALAFSRQIRSPPLVAQAELGLADALSGHAPADARPHAEAAFAIARDLGMRGVAERAESRLASLGSLGESAREAHKPSAAVRLLKDGEVWSLCGGGRALVLKDTKGLVYLDALLRAPHREIHVLELVGVDDAGDAGPLLDERAKRAYRERAESLREQLEGATRDNDLGRAARMREELEALGDELARAVGLGGRHRRAASPAERARVNVQRRVKDVVRRVRDEDGVLGTHLELSVRTGIFCVYSPTWPETAP